MFSRDAHSTRLPAAVSHPVITDLNVRSSPPSTSKSSPNVWHRVEKDLYLYTSKSNAWLHVVLANEEELAAEDLTITALRVGKSPTNLSLDHP